MVKGCIPNMLHSPPEKLRFRVSRLCRDWVPLAVRAWRCRSPPLFRQSSLSSHTFADAGPLLVDGQRLEAELITAEMADELRRRA